MPYPKEHKQRTRRRIVAAAGRLFAARGFEATSIDDVMSACGLTRGGFYAHFGNKAELYREAIGAQLAQAALGADDLVRRSARRATLGFLAADVGHAQPEVRQAFAEALATVGEALGRELVPGRADPDLPLAATAMLVGLLAIEATVDAPLVRRAFAAACRDALQSLADASDTPPTAALFWSPPEEFAAGASEELRAVH